MDWDFTEAEAWNSARLNPFNLCSSLYTILIWYTHCTVCLFSGTYAYLWLKAFKWNVGFYNSSHMALPTVHKFVFSVLYSYFWFDNSAIWISADYYKPSCG